MFGLAPDLSRLDLKILKWQFIHVVKSIVFYWPTSESDFQKNTSLHSYILLHLFKELDSTNRYKDNGLLQIVMKRLSKFSIHF